MFFKKKKKVETIRVSEELNAEIKNDKTVNFIRSGEHTGKSSVGFLEAMSERNKLPIFKGHVKHAYESDFIKYKDKCPRCHTPTTQMMSNFAYATQITSRLMTAPAGHYCTKCPTVIIDDDIMRSGIASNFKYGGVFTIENGYDDEPRFFESFNGEKPILVLDEDQKEIMGIVQSVHYNEDGVTDYLVPEGSGLYKELEAKRKKNSRLNKRNLSAKKVKRRNRRKR